MTLPNIPRGRPGAIMGGQAPSILTPITPSDIEAGSGTQYIDVLTLGNAVYDGAPTVEIVSQTGPATAVMGTGGDINKVGIDRAGGVGTYDIDLRLTATGNPGSALFTLVVSVVAVEEEDIIAGASDVKAGSALSLGWPSGIELGGIRLYAQIAVWATAQDTAVTAPAGWVLVAPSALTDTGDLRQWIYTRVGTAGLSTPLTVEWSATQQGDDGRLAAGRIYAVRNFTAQDAVGTTTSGAGASITGAALAMTTGNLGLMFGAVRVPDDNTAAAVSAMTGETTGDWVEQFEEQLPRTNHGLTLMLWSSSGSAAGGTAAASPSGTWTTTAIAAGAVTEVEEDSGGQPGETQPPSSFGATRTVEFYKASAGSGGDDHAALQSLFDWMGGGTSGSTRAGIFTAGKTYHTAHSIKLTGKSHFWLMGDKNNHAVIKRHVSWPRTEMNNNGQNKMLELTNCNDWGMFGIELHGNLAQVAPPTSPNPFGEHGHLFATRNIRRFKMLHCRVIEGQGDGWQLADVRPGTGTVEGSTTAGTVNEFPRDLLIENTIFHKARRNGLSLIAGHNIEFKWCTFSEASGTSPLNGCDVEPLNPDGYRDIPVENLRMYKCIFRDNGGPGFRTEKKVGALGVSEAARNVELDTCYIINNGTGVFDENGQAHKVPAQSGIGAIALAPGTLAGGFSFWAHHCEFTDMVTPPPSGTIRGLVSINYHDTPAVLIEDCVFRRNWGAHIILDMRNIEPSNPNTNVVFRRNIVDTSANIGLQPPAGGMPRTPVPLRWTNATIGPDNVFTGQSNQVGVFAHSTAQTDPDGASVIGNSFTNFNIGIDKNGNTITTGPPNNTFTNCTTQIEN